MASRIANPPELLFGQEVIHGDIKCLHYHHLDVHQISLKIQEDVEFLRCLSVTQNLQKISSLESVLYSSVWTLETNNFRAKL
jgi:hypothetical protein